MVYFECLAPPSPSPALQSLPHSRLIGVIVGGLGQHLHTHTQRTHAHQELGKKFGKNLASTRPETQRHTTNNQNEEGRDVYAKTVRQSLRNHGAVRKTHTATAHNIHSPLRMLMTRLSLPILIKIRARPELLRVTICALSNANARMWLSAPVCARNLCLELACKTMADHSGPAVPAPPVPGSPSPVSAPHSNTHTPRTARCARRCPPDDPEGPHPLNGFGCIPLFCCRAGPPPLASAAGKLTRMLCN